MQNQYVSYPGSTAIAADLTALTANDDPGLPNGYAVFVVAENEVYRLDTQNPLTTSSPLIVARGATSGAGKWYRRSRAYVVGNFTLWAVPFGGALGSGDSKIGGFTPGQITASNANAPDIILDVSADFPTATNTILGVTVDLLGNIWVTALTNHAFTAGVVKKYNLRDILASGSPTAAVSITLAPGTAVNNITSAFDKQNNLWLLFAKGGTFGVSFLQKFNQSTYQNSGTPTADISITFFSPGAVAPATANAQSLSFDAEGNLWVAIGFSAGSTPPAGGVVMIAASQLNTSNASLVPAVFWNGTNFAFASGSIEITGLAFGPTGLLWAASYNGNKVLAWDPRAPSSGNPAPTITLTSATFNGPISLAFDTSGNLWVANDNNRLIYRIPAASLVASGAVVPDIILSQATILAFPSQISFPSNPDRSGLLASGVPIRP